MEMTRLVIADDSRDMRWLIRSAVGDRFTEVVEAADGRALLWDLLVSTMAATPQLRTLVITDLCMPSYSGLEVLEAWRDELGPLPVILVTSFPSTEVHLRAAELGATVLAKPFRRRALQDLVDQLTR